MQNFTFTNIGHTTADQPVRLSSGDSLIKQPKSDYHRLSSTDSSVNQRASQETNSPLTSRRVDKYSKLKGLKSTRNLPDCFTSKNPKSSLFVSVLFVIVALMIAPLKSAAQINQTEGFENPGTPFGWTNFGFSRTIIQPCDGSGSLRRNFYGALPTGNTQTPIWISTGLDLAISFDYKIINFNGGLATPNDPAWGELFVEVSTNGGANYLIIAGSINPSNHAVSDECALATFAVQGALLPENSLLRVRIRGQWLTGDYFIYLDNISLVQHGLCGPMLHPGFLCDDGNPLTSGGIVDEDCNCVTISVPCNDLYSSGSVNIAIPDGNSSGINSTIEVEESGIITGFGCVSVHLSHTWVGDLAATLTHQASGTSVQLFRRAGSGSFGSPADLEGVYTFCSSGVNFNTAVGGLSSNEIVPPGEYAQGASGQASAPAHNTNNFAAFLGLELAGNWVLNIADFATPDAGSLLGWSFQACTATIPTIIPNYCGLSLLIPDNGCASDNSLKALIEISDQPGALGIDVILKSVDLIITHTWNSDLRVYLVSPNGVEQRLVMDRGGSFDGFGNLLFCPAQVLRLQDGGAPPNTISGNNVTGIFAPEDSFDIFNDGSNANGSWMIRICDRTTADIGQLRYIALNFEPYCGSPLQGGEISGNGKLCEGDIPVTFENVHSPSGHFGTLEYKWQISVELPYFIDIPDAISEIYTHLEPINQTTWFRRLAKVDCVEDWNSAVSSNVIELTPRALPAVACPVTLHRCLSTPTVFLESLSGLSPPSVNSNSSFSGPGVMPFSIQNGWWDFKTSIAGIGSHTITYTYINSDGCSNSCSFIINVYGTPEAAVAEVQEAQGCQGDNSPERAYVSVVLPGTPDVFEAHWIMGSNPAGINEGQILIPGQNINGILSLPSDTRNAVFIEPDAPPGVYNFCVFIRNRLANCSGPLSCNYTITVLPLPEVSCPQSFSRLINSGVVFLENLPGLSPPSNSAASRFTGPGVFEAFADYGWYDFFPNIAGYGVHLLTYQYTDENGCTNECYFEIEVNDGSPVNLDLDGLVFDLESQDCYRALQHIGITNSEVLAGGSLVLIAGQSIAIMPNFSVDAGGYFRAYISDDYCVMPTALLADEVQIDIPEIQLFEEKHSELKLYPNPTTGKFTIDLGNSIDPATSIKIYNLVGELIFSLEAVAGKEVFNLKNHPKGMYIVVIQNSEKTEMRKLIKQ